MTDRIDHAAEARRLTSAVTTRDWAEESPYVDRRTAVARVHATLALVEQQRIANLIALANGDTHLSTTAYLQLAVELGIRPAEFRPDIAAALGIETGAGDE